jgi:predicted transcriptional regulator
MGQQAFDTEKRLNGFMFKPKEPVIYGIDETGEIGKHLWVPDVNKPLPKDLIDSIRLHGVKTPIEVVKIDGRPFVEWGRTRVRVCRHLEETEGLEILIPATLARRGQTQAEVMAAIMAENLQRKIVNPFDLMEQIAYFIKMNGDDEQSMLQLRTATGFDQRRIEKVLRVRESPVIYSAVKKGAIDKVEAAIALAEMPADKQEEAMKDLQAFVAANPGRKITVEDARAKKMGRGKRMTFKRLNKIIKGLKRDKSLDQIAIGILEWVNGEKPFDELPEEQQAIFKEAEAKPKKEKAPKAPRPPKAAKKKKSKKKR